MRTGDALMVARALVYATCITLVAWGLVSLFPGLQSELIDHHLTGWLETIFIFAGFGFWNGLRDR